MVPAAQHAAPQACAGEQHAPPMQSEPPVQHVLPHCAATLQHWPKKQVDVEPQQSEPQTWPTGLLGSSARGGGTDVST